MVALLNDSLGLSVVADVENADQALRETAANKPDVVVLDIDMPGIDAFQAATEVRQISPKTEVIFLSGSCNDHFIESAKASGARGYVSSVVCGLILFGLAWFDKLPDILVNEQCDFTSLLNG